jgi:hypothetical protein
MLLVSFSSLGSVIHLHSVWPIDWLVGQVAVVSYGQQGYHITHCMFSAPEDVLEEAYTEELSINPPGSKSKYRAERS